jgi:hypothetical protein
VVPIKFVSLYTFLKITIPLANTQIFPTDQLNPTFFIKVDDRIAALAVMLFNAFYFFTLINYYAI